MLIEAIRRSRLRLHGALDSAGQPGARPEPPLSRPERHRDHRDCRAA
jgi:hypothetical protein